MKMPCKFKNDKQRKAVMSKIAGGASGLTVQQKFQKPFTPMPKNFHLPIETAVLVPRTDKTQEPVNITEFGQRIKETQKELSKNFGGFTSVKASGGYVMKDGKLVKEDVAKVTSFAKKKDYLKNRHKVLDLIKKKKKDWGQESIGFEFEGDMYYI